MSERSRDVVRYIKALEDTGGWRSVWLQSHAGPGFFQLSVPTADRVRATREDFSAAEQIRWGLEYIAKRFGSLDALLTALGTDRR